MYKISKTIRILLLCALCALASDTPAQTILVEQNGALVLVDSSRIKAKLRAQAYQLKRDSITLTGIMATIDSLATEAGIDATQYEIPVAAQLQATLEALNVDPAIIADEVTIPQPPKYYGLISDFEILSMQKKVLLERIAKHYEIEYNSWREIPKLLYTAYQEGTLFE